VRLSQAHFVMCSAPCSSPHSCSEHESHACAGAPTQAEMASQIASLRLEEVIGLSKGPRPQQGRGMIATAGRQDSSQIKPCTWSKFGLLMPRDNSKYR
jgi:hypothetical protein